MKRLKALDPNDYIEFKCHGIVHLIEKNKIRNLLDEPRKPLEKSIDPMIGQVIKEDISIEKILKGGIR